MAQLDSVEIKERLQKAFPKFKFSVTRSVFAGGHSVSVRVLSGNIKAMKDDSQSDYVSGLEYERQSDKLTDEMNAFLTKVRNVIDQVGSYNTRHGSSYLSLSLGSYSKPYVYTRGSSSSYTPQSRGTRSGFDYGDQLGSGYGWKLYVKYLSDKDVYVYNLVKNKETKPNREKWDEIRGLLATQEAFKWNPRTQTFQRWGRISDIATTSANVFRILGQYYQGGESEATLMPTPQPQVENEESMFKEGEKFKYTNTDINTIYTIEKITEDGRIFVSWKDSISGKEVTDWYWTSINGANKLLRDGDVEKFEDAQQPYQNITKDSFEPNDRFKFLDGLNPEIVWVVDKIEDEKVYIYREGRSSASFEWTSVDGSKEFIRDGMIKFLEPLSSSQDSSNLREITDEEAEDFADSMSDANEAAWRLLNINSGSDIYLNQDLQDKYVERMKTSLNNRLKVKYAYIMTDILNQSLKKVYDILSDRNEHILNNFLALSGFYGAEKEREAIEDYKKYPTRSLKPFNEVMPTQTQTTTSDNEEIKFKRGNLLIYKINGNINLISNVIFDESDVVTHFFNPERNGYETVAYKQDFWREKVTSGEVVLLNNIEVGDIFQYGFDLTFYKVKKVNPNETIEYDVIGNEGGVLDTIVADTFAFKLLLVSNPFRFLFELPSVLQGQQLSQKEKLEKAIKGLQYLADKGNEKAVKAIKGLKYLLNK